ncbi:MAG TPA: hypothetical protein PKY77_19420 [Phycisphaerae bacterium]|nr:hypothetical protein [Phycisphaerae bacterium]HRY68515.1 hypothetical protein [Phycisphaerae bacterium]HSA25563.1 hypothetical protein [Phycisphaerae bacterium]
MRRLLVFFGLLTTGMILSLAKMPYLRLTFQLASGELDGRPVEVTEFASVSFNEPTIEVQCGDLAFEVPARAQVDYKPAGELVGVSVEVDGLMFGAAPPREERPGDGLSSPKWEAWGGGEIDRRVAVCRSSGRELSFWMSAAEVDELEARLAERRFICLRADRVEVLRGETLSGLFLSWPGDGRTCLVFEYVTPDGKTGGSAWFVLQPLSERSLALARAIIGSFHLEAHQSVAVAHP